MPPATELRILIVDDNAAIHDDFHKILAEQDTAGSDSLDEMEALLLGTPVAVAAPAASFDLVSAMQGQEALQKVLAANAEGRPFALAFVDMRMPPGWDGLETIERIWEVAPELQIVICSAYSDYSWNDLRMRLGTRESLLILKKPFDAIEVVQCAHALTTKWALARQVRAHVDDLERAVAERTRDLEVVNAALADEMQQRERVEVELRLAQRLEAVGQLASGIAHEINTPIQYIGDNLQFLRDGVLDLARAATAIGDAAAAARTDATATLVDRIRAVLDTADVSYLAAAIPHSLDSLDEGVARIATIVGAMKELSHRGPREAAAIDLPRVLRNALDVTAGSYRCVADVEVHLDPTPEVICFGSEVSQVFLNLIVNAAQAMEDCGGARGTLGVSTRVEGDDVVVAISDTGGGIAVANRERIFDAFFTTKEVGRGTGQGLAISRSIVVDRHGGSLTFESQVDVGTTFFVRLPIAGPRAIMRG